MDTQYQEMSQTLEADGFLFAGDVHLTSRAPSRRKEGYADAALDKVAQVIAIANERRLVPVFTGDIFHWHREPDEAVKTRLTRIFASCWTTVLSNVGNHDKKGVRLADADTLAVLSETGNPLRVFRDGGPAGEYALGGMRIGLGFTPHDQEIPRDVSGVFPQAEAVIWVTHHDVGFEGAYPGAVDPHGVRGCQLVVNGHMHLEKRVLTVEGTSWFNPGSIMRTAIDAVNHEPCAWEFTPKDGLVRHALRFQRDAFDLVGRLVEEASPGEVVEAAASSVFVDLLEAGRAEAAPSATADGVMVLDALEARFKAGGVPPEVQAMVLDLHRRVVKQRAA